MEFCSEFRSEFQLEFVLEFRLEFWLEFWLGILKVTLLFAKFRQEQLKNSKLTYLSTLDSGIDEGQGIKVGPGKFG